jgi:hypothetical protein
VFCGFKELKGPNYSEQFHPIVGGPTKSFRMFFSMAIEKQHHSKASRARISACGTICINMNHISKVIEEVELGTQKKK